MIPVSTLYDEYIERRKFTEQKNPFEYIVPPPSSGSEQQMHNRWCKGELYILSSNEARCFVLAAFS